MGGFGQVVRIEKDEGINVHELGLDFSSEHWLGPGR